MDKRFVFAGILLLLLGFMITNAGAVPPPPTTTTSGTITSGTTTTTTSTSTEEVGYLIIRALDENGDIFWSASIYVDDVKVGEGEVKDYPVSVGTHTVSWGQVEGYSPPIPVTVDVEPNGYYIVEGQYQKIIIPTGNLVIETVNQDGDQLQGDIYLNGEKVGTGKVSLTLEVGEYTVSFGDIPGYQTPSPQTIWVEADRTTTVKGVYLPEGTETTTLTVYVEVCSTSLGTCWPLSNALVTLSDGQTKNTDNNGEAIFTVRTHSTYTVTVETDYGTQEKTVEIGGSPSRVQFTFLTSGLMILPFAGGLQVDLGLFLTILGAFLTIIGVIKKNE